MQLSTVIPVYNEEESLRALHQELDAVASAEGYELDIIFVDDGSSDQSWQVIESLAADDPRVQGIQLRRNFGKAAALNAGFEAARGELVMTLDADLQDDPKEIPRFIDKMNENLDCVSGWKQVRHDPWHKVGPSRVFNWMVGRLTGVKLHDHNCGFKCYRREIFDEVRLYGELHRFVPVLAAARGYRVGEIVVDHRARQFGHSKYGVYRIVKGFLDLLTVFFLTGYGQRPQHLLGTIGLLFFGTGAFLLTAMTAWWGISRLDSNVENNLHLTERALFFYSLGSALLGVQFMSIGFLAEMLTAYQSDPSRIFSVRKRIGGDAPPTPPTDQDTRPALQHPAVTESTTADEGDDAPPSTVNESPAA
ncbi:MAG TPA: glycosyltransferase [Planctomycetaceae bacterium]|nr:glycosyltransferase [Blastopirellula sp.]HAY80394.1 glycosyltransferase [Planctomycetaceae bacterium]